MDVDVDEDNTLISNYNLNLHGQIQQMNALAAKAAKAIIAGPRKLRKWVRYAGVRKQARLIDQNRYFEVKLNDRWVRKDVQMGSDRYMTKERALQLFGTSVYRTKCIGCNKETNHSPGCSHSPPSVAARVGQQAQSSARQTAITEFGASSSAQATGASASSGQTTSLPSTTTTTADVQQPASSLDAEAASDEHASDSDESDSDCDKEEASTSSEESVAEDLADVLPDQTGVAQTAPVSSMPSAVTAVDEDDKVEEEEDEEDEDIKNETIVAAATKYCEAVFEHFIKSRIPKFRNHRPAKRKGMEGPFKILFPTNYELLASSDSELKAFAGSPVAFAFEGSTLTLVDPAATHASLHPGKVFKCTAPIDGETRCPNNLNRDEVGMFVIEKSLTLPFRVYAVRRYRCISCSGSKDEHTKTRTVNCLSPEFLKQCHQTVQGEFEHLHEYDGSYFSEETLAFMRDAIRRRLSFAGMAAALAVGVRTSLMRATDKMLNWHLQASKSQGVDYQRPSFDYAPMDFADVIRPSARLLRTAFLGEIRRLEPFWQSHLSKNANGAKALAGDHVFLNGNKGTKHGASAQFNVVDHMGRPVASVCAINKSLLSTGVQRFLKKVHDAAAGGAGKPCPVLVFFSDNAKQDERALKLVFPQIVVMQDLFHFYQDYCEAVKRGTPMFTEWLRALAAATYKFDKLDCDTLRALLLAMGVDKDHVKILMKDPLFLKQRRDVKKYLVTSEEFVDSMDPIFCKFTRLQVFHKSILKLQGKIESKAKRVFDFPPAFPRCFVAELDSHRIEVSSTSGTSRVENLNRWMQNADTYRMSPELTHCILLSIMLGRSLTMNRRLINSKLLYLDDNVLMNQVLGKQKKLVDKHGFNALLDASNAMTTIPVEDYLTNHRIPENSTTKIAAEVVAPASPTVPAVLAPEAAPFEHRNERVLFVLIMRAHHQDLFQGGTKYSHLINEEGNLSDEFYSVTNTDGFDEVVKCERLSTMWNEYLIGAYRRKAMTIGPLLNVLVSVVGVKMKEPIHFKHYVERFAKSVTKVATPLDITVLQVARKTTKDYPKQTPADIPSTTELPSNSDPTGGESTMAVTESTPANQSSSGNKRVKLEAQHCPVCGLARHKSETSKACVFFKFMQEGNFPRASTDTKFDGARRAWVANLPASHSAS